MDLAQLLAFRFAVLLTALLLFPFPLDVLPQLSDVADMIAAPMRRLTSWFAEAVLGLGELAAEETGSGDTLLHYVRLLVSAHIALLGAGAWTLLDRTPRSNATVAAAWLLVVRYYLAYMLVSYGFIKIINSQFPVPTAVRLDQRVGDMSPMGLLWTFMGASQPYTVFAGVAEALPGVLLLWRRTATLGALLAIPVLGNVVILNLCYDVPVKLLSLQLLIAACVLVAPHAPRLARAVLGQPTPEAPVRTIMPPQLERARIVAKVLLLAMIAYATYHSVAESASRRGSGHELVGSWVVERYVVDGLERPALATDDHWRVLSLGPRALTVRRVNDQRERFGSTVDPYMKLIIVNTPNGKVAWRYRRDPGATEVLTLDGPLQGAQLHVVARRAPLPLLLSRGFHWVNEVPFNR